MSAFIFNIKNMEFGCSHNKEDSSTGNITYLKKIVFFLLDHISKVFRNKTHLVLLHKIIMDERNWFHDSMIARYGEVQTATPNLYEIIQGLEERVNVLEEKYRGALEDIKRLEEENVETTNTLYEIMHSVDAVDARIDILHTYKDE
jgi:hypothetical protein